MAAARLKELGCRRVAFLRIGSTLTNEPSKRKDGFVSACVEAGLPFEVMALEDGQPLSEFERFLDSRMEDGKLLFDGLFIGTDSLAWHIIRKLRERHIRVPEDVQVIGFDGIRSLDILGFSGVSVLGLRLVGFLSSGILVACLVLLLSETEKSHCHSFAW